MPLIAVYPGAFDPVTNGHLDLALRAARLFDRVVVGVAADPGRRTCFTLDERVRMIQEELAARDNIKTVGFEGLLVDFARKQNARIIVRGLRAVSDFEYEFQLAGMNRALSSELESVFMTPSEPVAFISSSLVREVARLGGDVSHCAPPAVVRALKKKFDPKED